jgi:hypothetical protein
MKILCFSLLLLLSCSFASAQQQDSTVARVVQSNLKVISSYLDRKDSSLQKISEAIAFFTELTGVASESAGKYYGQFHPTPNDLKAWSAWYELNKDWLIWDREIKSIVLYKKIKPSIL